MNAVSIGSYVHHHHLFSLGPKRRAEQTSGIFLLGQGREDVTILQPSANLCLYCQILYFMYKKGGKNLFQGKLLLCHFNMKEALRFPKPRGSII